MNAISRKKQQIIADFRRMLNDNRLIISNKCFLSDEVRFEIVTQKYDTSGPYPRVDYNHVVSVILQLDYSNFVEELRRVLVMSPFKVRGMPLFKLNISTLRGDKYSTLAVTDSSNLEFYNARACRVSDDLSEALRHECDIGSELVKLISADYKAYISSYNYHRYIIARIAN